jgi:hypothetical protein
MKTLLDPYPLSPRGAAMKVVYDCDPIFDEKSQAVKFAGQVVGGRPAGRFVICRVPKHTLVKRFRLSEADATVLLQCYIEAKNEITALATHKALLGDYRPVILLPDVVPVP